MVLKRKRKLMCLSLGAMMITVTGCSSMQYFRGGMSPQQAAGDNPPPLVQNCGIVSISSPTKYACNGKTYTSFELLKLRLAWEKDRAGGA
jgi:hypothetical protein